MLFFERINLTKPPAFRQGLLQRQANLYRQRRVRLFLGGTAAQKFAFVGHGEWVITSHMAGETQRYKENVLDILLKNLDRLWRGKTELCNQVV